MPNVYKPAADRIYLLEEEPMSRRQFQLILIDPLRVRYDPAHMDLESILADDVKDAATLNERVALRTQVIKNPLQPVNIGNKILQFFKNAPSASLVARRMGGILIEVVDGEDVPLFRLNADEVWELAHGGGYSTVVYEEALEVG